MLIDSTKTTTPGLGWAKQEQGIPSWFPMWITEAHIYTKSKNKRPKYIYRERDDKLNYVVKGNILLGS